MAISRWQSISRVVLSALLLLLAPVFLQAQSFSSEYDHWFKQYTLKYLYGLVPDDDWRWFKSQCHQESRLKPDAVSPAGATGLCQLMTGAAQDAGLSAWERTDAQKNIKAGAFILRRNIRVWWPRDTRFQRIQLGWAGYNAGAGWIVKAQGRCDNGRNWPDIAPCLHYFTGLNNSRETINYVAFIPKWYQAIVFEDAK